MAARQRIQLAQRSLRGGALPDEILPELVESLQHPGPEGSIIDVSCTEDRGLGEPGFDLASFLEA